MMNLISRKARIRDKLITINLFTTGVALLISGAALVVNEYISFRNYLFYNLTAQVRIIADSSAAPLIFNDRKTANETLSALKSSPNIDSAAIYDKEGNVFAEYRSPASEGEPLPLVPQGDSHFFARNHLNIFQSIVLDRETVGSLYIRSDLEKLYTLTMRHGVTTAATIIIVLGLAAMLLSKLQKVITLPLFNLADVMKNVSREKNYSLKADIYSEDEIGSLAKGFNEMLEQIQRRDMELQVEIAERRHTEEVLRQRQHAIEASSNGIMIFDAAPPDNPVIYVNPAFTRITGYSAEEASGLNWRFLLANDLDQMDLENISAAFRDQSRGQAVLRNYRKDGSLFWNDLSIAPVMDTNGRTTHFVGIITDITERKRYEEQLEYQANHDGLTGLPNRNLFADRIQQALFHARRYGRQVAVLLTDLDHFKIINDSLGHNVGDRLLKSLAERLTPCVRSGDTVARHGGDEFIIILADISRIEDAALVARKIHEAVSIPFEIDNHELAITCSIGISVYPRDGEDANMLLKNADAAMYRAKEQGRNTFRFYSGEFNEQVVARMNMETHLRHALERDELFLEYQPQIDLNTGRITGIEALVRWQNHELGLVSPGKFIPLAEETGLIVPIGEWILKTACTQNKTWQDAGLPPLRIAVNLSARQFWHHDIIGTVSRALRESGLDPHYLELEIVESMVMKDLESAASMLKELEELGIHLSIDDFGTGYSSLGYLKRLPFDGLKIDVSFIREITNDSDSAAIAKTIVVMAHNLELRVVAEGVETEGQIFSLRSYGCDEMQGFYFSRPIPAQEIELFLREDRRMRFPEGISASAERTLLLVEDDLDVVGALEAILRADGYQILKASDAQEGFELLAVNKVGVVVSDHRMPGMSGADFLGIVRELYPETIRIMLSGYTDFETISEAVNKGGVFKFLAKPFNAGSLRENVKEAFRYHALRKG